MKITRILGSISYTCLLGAAMLDLSLTACKPTATAPPLAPGYANQADEQMGSILAGARSFYTTIQQDSASGKTVLSQTEKDSFNRFGVAINVAEQVYLAYHAGTATQAQAQAAITAVQQQQAALPMPTGGTK